MLGGYREDGEQMDMTAKRELQEDTGLIPKDLIFMFKMHSSIGFGNELVNIFLAKDFIIGKQNFDPD